jgi:uncharacterized protein YjbI with pentapeptide repeats
MGKLKHLVIFKQGVEVWNNWRDNNEDVCPKLRGADLSGADLCKADLSEADLSEADLSGAFLGGADLHKANLSRANLSDAILSEAFLPDANLFEANLRVANLSGADLSRADLSRANLSKANLSKANLGGANLSVADLCEAFLPDANLFEANLRGADLSRANLSKANLESAILVHTGFRDAILSGCKIYGISAWDVNIENAKQNELIITQEGQPIITVDNIKVAQFIYLLLNNAGFREVIDTMTGKAVLILGRFGERKVILDSIADELRKRDYLPIMFDFERPIDRNFKETVQTLAGLSKFVIADLTDPKSTPLESLAIFYNYKIPFLPLIQEGQEPFSMFDDYKLEIGYIPPIHFKDKEDLKTLFDKQIILPAEEKHKEIREAKNK